MRRNTSKQFFEVYNKVSFTSSVQHNQEEQLNKRVTWQKRSYIIKNYPLKQDFHQIYIKNSMHTQVTHKEVFYDKIAVFLGIRTPNLVCFNLKH